MADASTKRIVCLANSRKQGDRCIAGKELLAGGAAGGWVRPVSDREDEAVNESERQYEDGAEPHALDDREPRVLDDREPHALDDREPRVLDDREPHALDDREPHVLDDREPHVLDVVDVPLRAPRPKGYQQENWLLDPNRRWRKVRRISVHELTQLADAPGPLWINGHHTRHGRNDTLPLGRARSLQSSLRLIRVGKLELDVFAPRIEQGDFKRRIKGEFRYAGEIYRLWVTDPVYEETYLNRPNGRHQLGECFLTVSLGEPYQGYAYKLIAAIIEL